MPTPRPFNAPVGFNPRIDPLGQVNRDLATGREALQRYQAVRPGASPATVNPKLGTRPGGFLGPVTWGTTGGQLLAPLAVNLGHWLRSPQGEDFKRSVQPENILSTITGAFRGRPANAGALRQYNPPGYDPNKPVTGADLLASARGVAAADIGGDGRSDEERALASQYAPKPFPMTQEGQFERYFKTPEFDYVFGAQTSKEPKTAAEMAALAAQSKAPTTSSLSDYYRSQSAMGRVNQAEIQKMYPDRPDLQKWAAENPMLAQREFVKRQGGRPLAPDQETVMGDLGSRAQDPMGHTTQAFGLPANPVPPTQQPGPGGMDQGTRVSFFRGADEIAPQQAMKTTGEGMPQFQTTLSKAEDFLRKF